jgi:glucose/arabinose dehydrogenase
VSRLAYTAPLLIAVALVQLAPANAQQPGPPSVPRSAPFTATLSNNTPLAFGMDVETVSRALQEPLSYLRGPPGGEIYLAHRNLGGSGLFNHHDRLYLQFRNGRLAGWKGDWGHNWMWQ